MSLITQIPKGIARDLGLPGRDILRGVRSTLAPAKALLPEPVQIVLKKLDASMVSAALPNSLKTGADFFSGDYADSVQFAMVAHAGLTKILHFMQRDHLMVSETVLALACRRAGVHSQKHRCASRAAAAIASGIMQHHAVGCMPGTPYGLGRDDADDICVATFALVLWLLVDRPDSDQSEADLLKLCYDVAVIQRGDILSAMSDEVQFAALLDANARMI